MTHFLDEEGNIAAAMNKQGRELASFLALVIDSATTPLSEEFVGLKCWKKKCTGVIGNDIVEDEILYWCTDCENAGIITGWEGTKWDLS